MSEDAIKLFKGLGANTMKGIATCTLGQIIKFDPDKMIADIQPLINQVNKDESTATQTPLINIPVAHIKTKDFIIRPPYQEGDIVVVVFADQDIENVLLTGGISNPRTDRSHSINDGIVIGGIQPINAPASNIGSTGDLVIAQAEGKSSIIMKPNGDIDIKAKNFTVKADTINLN